METHTDNQRPANGQLIFVPHKDTIRLMEVYVKRSLSLNEGALGGKQARRKEKWVTMAKRSRRSSSDPSLHLAETSTRRESDVVFRSGPSTDLPEKPLEVSEKPSKKSKKSKKSTFWKTLFGIFSQKNEEDEDSPLEVPVASEPVTTCLPAAQASLHKKQLRRKSIKRSLSKRLSKRTSRQSKDLKDLNLADITGVQAVEPTYTYYEKVSEEMEKIVHEVKEKEETLSDAEVLNRIIALTKEQGDAIENKLKENPTLNNFFQQMSYSLFQKLADDYLEKEVMQSTQSKQSHNPPTVPHTAPELVKLAFTLDFTARIAGLSKQNVGHITCLGNRYLQDLFEYKQACSNHPWTDSAV